MSLAEAIFHVALFIASWVTVVWISIDWTSDLNCFAAKRLASLLTTANACNHPAYLMWKHCFFFRFKEKLLIRYGTFTGYARQEIEKGECFNCHNYWEDAEDCLHCGGTGIYKEIYYLRVYELGDRSFMIPLSREERMTFLPSPAPVVLRIEGLTQHAKVALHEVRRAVIILFLMFDVAGFIWHTRRELHNSLFKRCELYRDICNEISLQVWIWRRWADRDNAYCFGGDDEIPF